MCVHLCVSRVGPMNAHLAEAAHVPHVVFHHLVDDQLAAPILAGHAAIDAKGLAVRVHVAGLDEQHAALGARHGPLRATVLEVLLHVQVPHELAALVRAGDQAVGAVVAVVRGARVQWVPLLAELAGHDAVGAEVREVVGQHGQEDGLVGAAAGARHDAEGTHVLVILELHRRDGRAAAERTRHEVHGHVLSADHLGVAGVAVLVRAHDVQDVLELVFLRLRVAAHAGVVLDGGVRAGVQQLQHAVGGAHHDGEVQRRAALAVAVVHAGLAVDERLERVAAVEDAGADERRLSVPVLDVEGRAVVAAVQQVLHAHAQLAVLVAAVHVVHGFHLLLAGADERRGAVLALVVDGARRRLREVHHQRPVARADGLLVLHLGEGAGQGEGR